MAKGKKTGGRQKGTPNKRTTELFAELEAEGEMPLAYMLRRMRDPQLDWRYRDDMAKAAAPYCHARLAATEVTGKDGGPVQADFAGSARNLARGILELLHEAQIGETK